MPTRRELFQWSGIGVLTAMGARCSFAAESASAERRDASQKAKRAYELGLAGYTVHKLPFDVALSVASRVGLKHFCVHPAHLRMNSSPEEIEQGVAKYRAAGLDLYGCGVVYMKKPEEVHQAFEFVKAAGIKLIVAVPQPDLLPLVNEKVQKYDVRVAIHNHGPGDKVYPTPDLPYAKIKNLDPRMGLCIDIGHTCRSGMDPSQAIEQFGNRLFEVHIKDIDVASAKGRGLEVGRGVIDIPKVLGMLDRIRYAGIVAFEYEKDLKDPLAGLAESVGYVRGVLAAV